MFAANSCYLKYQVSLDVNNWGSYALDESAPLTYYTAADVAKWDARDDGIVTNCQAFTSGAHARLQHHALRLDTVSAHDSN